ncbi:MAG TPA: acyl-CoA ligase (AMP-forming), exosortase A system-associated [Steroidobacteraceae bacterium]|jgi:acyl-CoA ligase (AMP-forming) (exosortase A-associated)
MSQLLHELLLRQAGQTPQATALVHKDAKYSYEHLAGLVEQFGRALLARGLRVQDRVAVFLPKQLETVVTMFGAARAGLTFVPVNPILKAPQVKHILGDCDVRVLVTSPERYATLERDLLECPALYCVVLVGSETAPPSPGHFALATWSETLRSAPASAQFHRIIDMDMLSILYTSGSTGRPKGVVLSHRNMVTGAHSVAQYLENTPDDRLLAVLPFSFDYGFSQLSTAFSVGASVVLMDYLFPRDILTVAQRERVTGLAGVPPLWAQLADLEWPAEVRESLRYITNSGGAMPGATLAKLRSALPRTRPFLMYGLTEAFRSTYLPPAEIDRRPGSMGKAIPNAEILVVRPDGTPCEPNEVGELVHRGSLVSLGYWNDPQKTAERFKPAPGRPGGLVIPEIAVWSGDQVRKDEDGYLYFVGRRDEMIKTSGYRVSPTEIEEVVFATGLISDAAAVGVPHPTLGQAVALVVAGTQSPAAATALLNECKKQLPAYMVPAHIEWREAIPRNPNGKYDRALLSRELSTLFAAQQ